MKQRPAKRSPIASLYIPRSLWNSFDRRVTASPIHVKRSTRLDRPLRVGFAYAQGMA